MQTSLAHTSPREARLFAEMAVHALVRAEESGRLPERLSVSACPKWAALRGELGEPELVELAILDGAAAFQWAFASSAVLGASMERGFLAGCRQAVRSWVASAQARARLTPDDFLRWAAERLLPPGPKWGPSVPVVHPGDLVLELPGTGGLLAYRIVSASPSAFLQDSFVIACGSWRERLYAGLVALELTTPAGAVLRTPLDPDLSSQLVREGRFDLIVGAESAYRSVSGSLAELLLPGGELRLL